MARFFAVFGGAAVGTAGLVLVLIWSKLTARAAPESPDTAGTVLGSRLPFGPMLAVAGGLYFLLLHRWVDPWIAQQFALPVLS